MKNNNKIKAALKAECIRILEQRIEVAQNAMLAAQESANSEGKSSAGDKYETARAMGQQDRDMNARQLEQARRDLAFLRSLEASAVADKAGLGSLIICDQGIYYLAAGLGSVQLDGQLIHIISPAAPLAALFMNKQSGDSVLLNGKSFKISEII